MDLLQFAKGPALHWSLVIFVFGVVWRLAGLIFLPRKGDLSEPRNPATWKGLRMIVTRSWPRREFLAATAFTHAAGYVFHIGFFVVLFFSVPHLLFFEDLFKGVTGTNFERLVGVPWPHLSGGVIYFVGAVSLATLIVLLGHRLVSPVKRLISNFDDYFTWLVTTVPFVTGLAAYGHIGAPYQTLLALHILSLEVFLVWFPFGKLMHAFTVFGSRGATGMQFERKGATL